MRHMAAYGLLAMPLAFAGLPLYVFAPKFYTDHAGLSLALMGVILIACRAFDAVQDPVLGWFSERYITTQTARRRVIRAGLLGMVGGFAMLFHPAWAGSIPAAVWFTAALVITFTCYSLVLINYYAYSAVMTRAYYQQTAISAWREGAGLVGVLLASVLPVLLAVKLGERGAYGALGGLLAIVAGIAVLAQLIFMDVPAETQEVHERATFRGMMRTLASNRDFLTLAAIYLVSGIAAGIPATLVLFYVQDVLGTPNFSGLFLACYFLSGALAMPLWSRVIRHSGKKRAWLASMVIAVVAFGWAFLLDNGDYALFTAVCLLSGIALGADLAIPPAMLADTLRKDEGSAQYFGVWAFVAKLGLALASGISLLALDLVNYVPGHVDAHGKFMLAAVYALLPCAFKLIAACMLAKCGLDRDFREKQYAFS